MEDLPFRIMESNWTKADFKGASQWEGAGAELLRLANESLARDLAMNLSAFLRASVTVGYAGAAKAPFSDYLKDEDRSCFVAILTRPDEYKLMIRADYSVLFPMIGIALGAKAGAFNSPSPRKPTEIELQVVTLVFRLILSEVYRSWTSLLKKQLETVTLEVEQTPSRFLPAAELMSTTDFDLTVGESTGKLTVAAPAGLFAGPLSEQLAEPDRKPGPGGSAEKILDLMMAANVTVDIWLDPSEIRLRDLLQLEVGQIVKLDHTTEQKVGCTLNGKAGFEGQIVSTGARRAFLVEDFAG